LRCIDSWCLFNVKVIVPNKWAFYFTIISWKSKLNKLIFISNILILHIIEVICHKLLSFIQNKCWGFTDFTTNKSLQSIIGRWGANEFHCPNSVTNRLIKYTNTHIPIHILRAFSNFTVLRVGASNYPVVLPSQYIFLTYMKTPFAWFGGMGASFDFSIQSKVFSLKNWK